MVDTPLQSEPPAAPRLRWWDMALPIMGGVAMLALFSLGVAVFAFGSGNSDVIRGLANHLQSKDEAYLLNMGIMAALYLPPMGVMFRIARRRGLDFFHSVPMRVAGWAFAGGIAYAVVFELVQDGLISSGIVSFTPSPGELLLIPHNILQLALGLLVAAVIGPFVEEFYFRGLLLSWCRGKMSLALATLINAGLFGIVHFYFLQHPGGAGILVTLAIAAFGALNVWWVVRTGSLWPAFASHAAYNGAGLILMFLFPGAG